MGDDQRVETDREAQGAEIAALLKQQRDLYLKLRRLADGQRALITGSHPERLLDVLSERQRLVDELQAVSRRLKPFQANWRQVRLSLTAEDGDRVDGLVAEVNTLLSGILEQDEADARLLSARKSETARAMTSLRRGRQAGAAYTASAGVQNSNVEWTDA